MTSEIWFFFKKKKNPHKLDNYDLHLIQLEHVDFTGENCTKLFHEASDFGVNSFLKRDILSD